MARERKYTIEDNSEQVAALVAKVGEKGFTALQEHFASWVTDAAFPEGTFKTKEARAAFEMGAGFGLVLRMEHQKSPENHAFKAELAKGREEAADELAEQRAAKAKERAAAKAEKEATPAPAKRGRAKAEEAPAPAPVKRGRPAAKAAAAEKAAPKASAPVKAAGRRPAGATAPAAPRRRGRPATAAKSEPDF